MHSLARKILCSLIFCTISTIAPAAPSDGVPPSSPPSLSAYGDKGAPAQTGQSAHDAALEKALAICSTAAPRDDTGHPDWAAVDDCMNKKGLGKPHDGGHKAPPPGGTRPNGADLPPPPPGSSANLPR